MIKNVLGNEYKIKKIKLSQIKDKDKMLIDIEEKEIQTKYMMKNVEVISKEAAILFLLLHPIIVTMYTKKGEDYYKVIAGKRSYHIVNTVFNDDDKILVLVVKVKNEKMLRGLSSADCVGSPFAYSCCDRLSLKSLIISMKDRFLTLFPLLKEKEMIAGMIGVTVETLFYNVKDRNKKETEKTEDDSSVEVEENFSKRYKNKRAR